MSTIQLLLKEIDREAEMTRKMLERVPADKYDWKPHPKSMTLRQLATHLAELPTWVHLALTTDELDFEKNPYEPKLVNSHSELMSFYDQALTIGRSQLAQSEDKDLEPMWTLRSGEAIYSVEPKSDVIRMVYCQNVHHRAQLGVYLRLLNIPIPGSYGPSADELESMN